MNCFICGGDLKLFCQINKQEIYCCPICGLGVTKNLSSQKGNYHRDETYLVEKELFTNIFQKRIKAIYQFKKSGRVLEVGCSTGIMLGLLQKRGFQVMGVEISQVSAAEAKEKGLEVIIGKFEGIKFKEKFDVIILNHTLEHLENPRKVIEKCQVLLNDGGILYVDVPNFGSLSAGLQKCSWPSLLPNEHLWHFTKKSLMTLLKENQLKIIYVEQSSGIFDLANPVKELIFALTHFKKRFFEELITIIPSFFISKLQMGTDLMIISQK